MIGLGGLKDFITTIPQDLHASPGIISLGNIISLVICEDLGKNDSPAGHLVQKE